MTLKSILFVFFLSAVNFAVAEETQSDKNDNIDRINDNVRLAFNVSALDMPFPLSAGISVIYQNNPKWMLEFNYLRNLFAINVLDVDTQELGQQHFSIKAHYYIKDNFYSTIGLGKRFTRARMSDEFFDYNNYSIESTISKFNSDYITLGVGSVFKINDSLQLNLDWAAFNFAFAQSTSQSAISYADGDANKLKVSQYEQTLEGYMSNSFLRLTVLGQY